MIMPNPSEEPVLGTGGQIDGMVMSLIDAAYDKKGDVRRIIISSLVDIGKKKTKLVLSSCHSYLRKHNKLPKDHRTVILQTMERVLKESPTNFPGAQAIDLIKLASDEMTASKDVEPEWQTAASNVLVALGTNFCNDVMENLYTKFQPGALPHFFVVQTLANLANVNPFGFVPHLSAVMSTMIPMLGMAKHDNMKWVFSSAFARFSESILHYVANIDTAPDNTVRKETYADQIFSGFDVLFSLWLPSKEAKLRLIVVEAMGPMTHIMTREKLDEQLPRLVPSILALYKKHQEPFFITQGLCMILDAAAAEGSIILEPQLETILNTLHAQVCVPADYTNPMGLKNHNEVRRCFSVLAKSFPDRVVTFLLTKLDNNNERIRIGTLAVFKQLINSAGPHMEDKKPLILSGLKIVLQENNNKVKKMFAQVVIAMADHDYLSLEGGYQMVEFIVKQCTLTPDPQTGRRITDPEYVSNEALRAMCENVLHLITTTIASMEEVLWPFMLEFVALPQYTDGIMPLCHNLAYIAAKKREAQDEDYQIDFETQVNIPKPCAIISRLMVLAGRPDNGRKRGVHVLRLLEGLGPILNENIADMWDTVIPKLIQYLDDNLDDPDKWSQKSWEDLLLKLLSKTLDDAQNEDWIGELGASFGEQVALYQNMPEEKNFIYKCLGIMMRKVTNKQFIQKHLDILFSTIKHSSQVEREGCAIGLGFCASSHLDLALTKLETVVKGEMSRKSSGFFNFGKDKGGEDTGKIKSTVMLCYGYLTLYAPTDIIASRVEANILKNINPHFQNVKDTAVKQNLIRAVDLIGKALHPEHLKTRYSFAKKTDLLGHMMTFMKADSTKEITTETRSLALQSCATLVKLDPLLSDADAFTLIQTGVNCLFKLPNYPLSSSKGKEEVKEEEIKEFDFLIETSLDSLNDMLKELLRKDLTPIGFQNIFKHLHPWMLSTEGHERQRAVEATSVLLLFFFENIVDTTGGPPAFTCMGEILAHLVPRCSDPCIDLRSQAIEGIQITLKLALLFEGRARDYKDNMVEAFSVLRKRSSATDAQSLFGIISDLSKALARRVPSEQLEGFVFLLIDGLLDPQSHCSSGACVVLNTILKSRGIELLSSVRQLMAALHTKLSSITFPQTRTGTLRAIRTLASTHLEPVLNTLLRFPLPYDQHIMECWRTLAGDAGLLQAIFDRCLDLMARNVHVEEKVDPKSHKVLSRVANLLPLSVVSALTETFLVEESEDVVSDNFPRLFSGLLVYIGSCVGKVKPPSLKSDQIQQEMVNVKDVKAFNKALAIICPGFLATEAMKALLARGPNSADLMDSLSKEGVWNKLQEEDQYEEGVEILGRAVAEHRGNYVARIIGALSPNLNSLFDTQRIVTTAFLAELVNQKCAGDISQVEIIMNNLLGRLVDQNAVVRKLCVRGLGNIASLGSAQVQKYSTTVLSSMMAGMDDKDDPEDSITLEAMSGLTRILMEISESNVRPVLINVTLRIRPCFEKDRASVRAAAFTLFGNLSRFGDGPSRDPFLEQIHTNFVSLLLHLNDEDDEVKAACKLALRKFGPLMGSASMNDMFQKHLIEDRKLNYGEFMYDLSKVIIADLLQKVNFYVMGNVSFFRSSWPDIRGNAAMCVGFLLGNLPKDNHSLISKDHVCGALIQLLKDPEPSVRIKASEAMSLLYLF
ncbi:maestro heat-like repeat-containing protein family member 1 [Diadema setosum]|uniref:maestro heat-like repeat-containing protein family member 1 n=1 Tax=Diadema setosum TaxID=31175 RepID=UPI003B3A429B